MSASSDNSITVTLRSEADTKLLGQKLAALDLAGSVWLIGDLGAGKTTLTRYWLQALGHDGAVKSPTYTLVEPYALTQANGRSKSVYHVDLYRLQDAEELSFIGFEDYQNEADALLIIEWPSRAEDHIATPIMHISIQQVDTEQRQVQITLRQQGIESAIDLSSLQLEH